MRSKRLLLLSWTHPFGAVEGPVFGVHDAFQSLGWTVDLLNMSDVNRKSALFQKTFRSFDLAISFGSIPLKTFFGLKPYDVFGERFFVWLVDPFMYDFLRFSSTRAYFEKAPESSRLCFLFPDRSYRNLVSSLVGEGRTHYFPFAGERLSQNEERIERNCRYVVFATLGDELGGRHDSIRDIFKQINSKRFDNAGIDRLVERLANPYTGVNVAQEAVDAFGLSGLDLLARDSLKAIASVDSFEKHRRRMQTVEKLLVAGLQIDFYGTGWEAFDGRPNARLMGFKRYSHLPDLLRRYRGLINFDPNWNDGYHDRAYMSLCNGARLINSPNRAKAEILSGMDGLEANLIEYDQPNELLMQRVETWNRSNPDPSLAEKFFRRHNWLERVERFVGYLEEGPRNEQR